MADIDAIVETFTETFRTGTADSLIAHLAPGAIVWHNHDRQEVDAEATLRGVGALGQIVRDLKPDILRVAPTPDGFVMQFVLRGTVIASERPFEMQNCVIVSLADDKITRIDEYVDPTLGAQLA